MAPMLSGVGAMYDVLDRAGPTAKRDMLLHAAPLYGLGRVASLFRPLSPKARGVAATAACAAGAAVLGGLAWAAIRKRRG